jgi:hypothetical protein
MSINLKIDRIWLPFIISSKLNTCNNHEQEALCPSPLPGFSMATHFPKLEIYHRDGQILPWTNAYTQKSKTLRHHGKTAKSGNSR